MPRTALVTGATGYIGRHLARALIERGWRVHALLRQTSILPPELGVEAVHCHGYDGGTESVISSLEKSEPDVAFHLASLYLANHHPEQVTELLRSNVMLGAQLAEAMTLAGCLKLVNVGTGWQHYEQSAYNPVNLYAATKQALEDLLEYYVQARGLRVITLKLFETYGPDDLRPKIINLLRQAAAQQAPLDLSPGEQLLDLVYIDDVVDAFLTGADRLAAGIGQGHERFVVSSGQRISLRELVACAEEVLGRKIPVSWGAKPYRRREVMVPCEGGRCLPDWRPKVSLVDGLSRTLRRIS